MKLNRHNYEEVFILYLDNELDAEDRRQVDAFVQENPDLKAELDLLLQSKLSPDADIKFEDKGSLIRFNSLSIGPANYEEWLVSYIDNELTDEERIEVERFVAGNPAAQKELDLLQQVKLQPEAIVFPNKESLYRREEKAPRIIAMRWWKIAAAAVLLFAVSITTIVLWNNKTGNEKDGLVVTPPKNENSSGNPVVKQQKSETPPPAVIADNDKVNPPVKEDKPAVAATKKNNEVKEKNEQPSPLIVQPQEQIIAKDNIEKRPTNDLPQPINNPNVVGKAELENATASTGIPKPEDRPLTNPKGNQAPSNVTNTSPETSDKSDGINNPIDNPDVKYASNSGQKGGLRGFFRKITRTVEKKANLQPSDGDDRLLIAGLSIKLKN